MEIWNRQANQLESALMSNTPALVLHFLRTAPGEAIAELADETFLEANLVQRASVVATLANRLEMRTRQSSSG